MTGVLGGVLVILFAFLAAALGTTVLQVGLKFYQKTQVVYLLDVKDIFPQIQVYTS